MKILLINSNLLKPPITPLGLAYVATATRETGHEVSILDLNFSDDVRGDITQTLHDHTPHVIGISMRNIDNVTMLHDFYFMLRIKEIVDFIREQTDVTIVFSGSGFSMMPVEIMEELNIPYGIVGEGEIAFPQLLDCIWKNSDISKVQGAAYWKRGKVALNKVRNMSSVDLDLLSLPARGFLDN